MPRRQKTAPQASGFAVDPDSLPELTDQQHKFVIALLEGKNASDAYRHAYPVSLEWTPEALWVAASRLHHNAKVRLWLRAAVLAGQDRAVRTVDRHISELSELQHIAVASGNIGAAVQAATQIGKVSQLYRDSVEIVARQSDIDLVKAISQGDEDMAKLLRKKLLGDDA